jgi:hypothetical protein
MMLGFRAAAGASGAAHNEARNDLLEIILGEFYQIGYARIPEQAYTGSEVLKEGVLAMPVTVKKIMLWRLEVENKPGVLAGALESLACAGADLQVVMGYRIPADITKAAIEVFPVKGKKSIAAAQAAGLHASSISTLLV